MNSAFYFSIGLVFLGVGLGYLYRPDIISRLNAFFRDSIFNDSHINLERRKWGVFFLLLAFIFLYVAWQGWEVAR